VRFANVAGGGNAESGAVRLQLAIAQPGFYQCDAHAEEGGAALDGQMALSLGGAELARDSDSGDGFDSRIARQLAPGTYEVRVWEWQNRASSIRVTCSVGAPPPAPVSALTLGAPSVVAIAAGQGAGSQPELPLTIAVAGNYRCDASAAGRDAQMAIVQNGQVVQQDSDSGEGTDARIVRQLTPGLYHVRVWEWMHRDTSITVRCAPDLAPVPAAANGTLALGTPATVQVAAGEGPIGQVNLTLTVPAGRYQCDAQSGLDAQLAIVQNGVVLQQDSDSGEGTDARITRDLAAGVYQVRVWEWLHRATPITVRCAPQ